MFRGALLHQRVASVALLAAVAACGETVISISDPGPSDAGSEPAVDLESGLVAYFPFEELEAGAPVLDASGFGHHGTPSVNPPTPSLAVPPVGFANLSSLAFNGTDQLVDLGDPATLDLSGELTLAAWIRPAALDGYRNILAHGFRWDPHGDLALRINEGTYVFTAWDGVDHMATAPVPEGDVDDWHHLVGVYHAETYELYRDGQLIAEHADGFAPPSVEARWAIGGRSASVPAEDRYFAGMIDEVHVYDRALSHEEVRALFRR